MEKRKETETQFNQLPARATDFIKLIVNKMRYRRKVQRDVQTELAAHFEDELKDCASDQEKEQKAQKLIAEFGDVKLLAVLLRRAKKRCRPLWRTVVARTFQTIGILILCFIIYTVWFLTGKPAISVDYLALLNQMSRPQVRDEDNAWPYYEKAINLYIEPVKDGVVEEFISYWHKPSQLENILRFTDLSKDEQTEILQWIQQNQKHWDSLSAEQQAIILKCFSYNWIPFLKESKLSYTGATFDSAMRYIVEDIRGKNHATDLLFTSPEHPEHSEFPDAELMDWIKQDKVPPNYIEAVSVAVLHEWMKRYNDLPKTARIALSDPEYEYLSPWMRKNEAAWRQFKAGSSKLYCYRQYSYEPNKETRTLFDIVLPHLSTIKSLARFGILRCRINLKEGKTHQGLEDCIAVARAGSHWQGKGTIIEQLVGIAISALAHEQILNILATTEIPAADLKQVQQQLSEVYSDGYPLMNMEGERLMFLDTVQHVFTDSGPGGGHLIPDRWSRWMDDDNDFSMWRELKLITPLFTAASMVHARRDETLAKANEIYDQQSEIAKLTLYERHVREMINTEEMLYALPRYRYFLVQYFMPAFELVSEIVYRAKISHESTVTILALKQYRLEKNEYPAILDELVTAGYLKELPTDPYSDKPLVYKRIGDDFILYSVGPNFTDDGGEPGKNRDGRVAKWRDNGDTIFWPIPKENEQD